MPRSIQQLLIRDSAKLAASRMLEISSARIEVQCLLQCVLQVERAYLLAHPERGLAVSEYADYLELLNRRLLGEPVAYILGVREFFGLSFKVNSATLIPRPETELLVAQAMQCIPSPPGMEPPTDQSSVDSAGPVAFPHMGALGRQTGTNKVFKVLDLGTGCGAIALTIAHSRPNVDVVAVDNSADALAVARENAERLLQPLIRQDDLSAHMKHATNLHLVQGNWFEMLSAQQFDLIVSNPPYVAIDDPHILQGDLRFEPPTALVSGDDGLNDIRHIIMHAPAYLRPGGWLMLEHGYNQAVTARRLLQESGFTSIYSARDLAGIERVSAGQLA